VYVGGWGGGGGEGGGMNWRETVPYPPNAPLSAGPEGRGKNGRAATAAGELTAQVCDRWGAGVAILNCLYGVGLLFSEDMAAAFTRPLNDLVAKEQLTPRSPPPAPLC